MASVNTQPPVRCLILDTRVLTNEMTSASVIGFESGFFGARTTYARGFSSSVGLGVVIKSAIPRKGENTHVFIPMTAASMIKGCSSSRASSSAGATCAPRTFISSCRRSIFAQGWWWCALLIPLCDRPYTICPARHGMRCRPFSTIRRL